jgi:chemotaxis regulatin CheY-phosphate phosphatase CheZ
MNCAIMGNLDGSLTRLAFDIGSVKEIVSLERANLVLAHDDHDLFLKLGDRVCVVERKMNGGDYGNYFIVLNTWKAFNVKDYQILFNVKELPDQLISGTDVTGREHLCRKFEKTGEAPQHPDQAESPPAPGVGEWLSGRPDASFTQLEAFKDMISKFKQGEFFEALTMEFTGKLKEIALELIDFRRDLQRRLEPGIVDLAEKDIPEASNQLEAVNDTLEQSTMKIMDINDEIMGLANAKVRELQALMAGSGEEGTRQGSQNEMALGFLGDIKGALQCLPAEEAKGIVDFIVPGLDRGIKTLAEMGNSESARDVLGEPLSMIEDLMGDLGPGLEASAVIKDLVEKVKSCLDALAAGTTGNRIVERAELSSEQARDLIGSHLQSFRELSNLALSMMEPLSFQDLVGQRIQRIIKLVKSMEVKIEDLIISFGIKMRRYREDPTCSFEALRMEVEEFKGELKGPQREGEGLDQASIDQLLATL